MISENVVQTTANVVYMHSLEKRNTTNRIILIDYSYFFLWVVLQMVIKPVNNISPDMWLTWLKTDWLNHFFFG